VDKTEKRKKTVTGGEEKKGKTDQGKKKLNKPTSANRGAVYRQGGGCREKKVEGRGREA